MSVARLRPSNSHLMQVTVQRLFEIVLFYSLICGWIVFAQVYLNFLSPVVSTLLMHITVMVMAELSWRQQATTMHIWHPMVQLCFCVTRIIHGSLAIVTMFIWAKVFWLNWQRS